jgi:SPP1 family phage portal protein
MFGRKKIYCNESVITKENVAQVLRDALVVHRQNSLEIDDLHRYYRGIQPVLDRTKVIRPEINNKIVENRAYEFVDFKTGYMLDGPIQYISRSKRENVTLQIGELNDMMVMCDKESKDSDLFEWMYICGTAYRMVFPNSVYIKSEIIPKLKNMSTDFAEDESPFDIYTLDPRNTFVVYHSGLGEKPIMAVMYVVQKTGTLQSAERTIYGIYTPTDYFEISSDGIAYAPEITTSQPLALKSIPIIEYPLNCSRLGIVEIIQSISDAINMVQSNRLDGVQQFVESLLVLYNADIDEDAAKYIREAGLIKLKSTGENKADIKEIVSELNQQQTQVLVDYMYATMLSIIGIPNRNGGSSTSDTGSATLIRDGWESTERRAKKDEKKFKSSERQFLKIVLRIMRDTVGTSLQLYDIDTKFPARSYKNKMAMAQMLTNMLNSNKIHPLLAFTECELFDDPQAAYQMSMDYYEKNKAEALQQAQSPPNSQEGEDGQQNTQVTQNAPPDPQSAGDAVD